MGQYNNEKFMYSDFDITSGKFYRRDEINGERYFGV